MSRRFLPGVLLVVLILACGSEDPPAKSAATPIGAWRLSSLPAVDIGVAEGDPPYELTTASSSLQLPDGRVVIANGGSNELRVFDSQGRFLRSIGRKGGGPGEFGGPLHLALVEPDSFLAYDMNQQRLSVFDSSGEFVRATRVAAEGREAFPLWTWLYARAWVIGPVDTLMRNGVSAAIDRMPPPPAGGYRFVVVARDGRLWTQSRDAAGSNPPWEVFSAAGSLLARIAIPRELEVHQIGPDYVLLRHWDSNDVEHIQLFRLEGVTAGSDADPTISGPAGADSAGPVPAALVTSMATGMSQAVTAQEMYFSDNNGYARQTGQLRLELSEGMALHLLAADQRGWVGVMAHETMPVICGMAVGSSTPPGWMEGMAKCSRDSYAR